MPELIQTRSEEEWLEARRRGVTASEIAILLGISPYSSPYALYHAKRGTISGEPDSAVMERGRVLEPYIRGKFAQAHPEFAVIGDGRQLWRHDERPWQMATPDAVVHAVAETDACTCYGGDTEYGHEPRCGLELGRPVAVAEFKVDGGSDEWGDEGSADIPVHYRAQVLWQMDVMDVGTAYVACLRVRDWRIREYVVQLDDDARKDLELMRGEAEDFLADVRSGMEPDLDWRPATLSALKTIYSEPGELDVPVRRSLVTQYRAAVRRYREAERRKDEMTARMLAAIGTGRRAIDVRTAEPVATRSVSYPRRIDPEKLRSKYPDAAADCTREPKPEIKITPAKEKKNAPDGQ